MSDRAQALAAQFTRNSDAVIIFAERRSVDDWRLITNDERWSADVVRHLSDTHLDRTVKSPLDDVMISVQQMVEGMIDHPCVHLKSLRATVGRQSVERQEGTK